jgi:hypothetical protein
VEVEWQGWAVATTTARAREASRRRKRGGRRDTAYAHYF